MDRQQPRCGQQGDEPGKGGLDRRQVRVNIGMVEFDAGQDGHLGPVMKELGAFVEKGRVVLVALDYKKRAGTHLVVAFITPQDTAHHKTRRQAGVIQNRS